MSEVTLTAVDPTPDEVQYDFEVVATIDDHPRGHRNLLMRKRLVPI